MKWEECPNRDECELKHANSNCPLPAKNEPPASLSNPAHMFREAPLVNDESSYSAALTLGNSAHMYGETLQEPQVYSEAEPQPSFMEPFSHVESVEMSTEVGKFHDYALKIITQLFS